MINISVTNCKIPSKTVKSNKYNNIWGRLWLPLVVFTIHYLSISVLCERNVFLMMKIKQWLYSEVTQVISGGSHRLEHARVDFIVFWSYPPFSNCGIVPAGRESLSPTTQWLSVSPSSVLNPLWALSNLNWTRELPLTANTHGLMLHFPHKLSLFSTR